MICLNYLTSKNPIAGPKGLASINTKLIKEHISQAITYLFAWEPSQLPSESFVLPHWHFPLLLELNSVIMLIRHDVDWVVEFIILILIKSNKIKVIKSV